MKLTAVVGANYGDEGKGLITDFLCSGQPNSLVVRYNGGAQAGHTVVTPAGHRHIFSHFGSGTLADASTYLSRFFILHSGICRQEAEALKPFKPRLIIHPQAMISTPWDIIYNRACEQQRDKDRHGSCGLGIWETELRHRCGLPTLVEHIFDGTMVARLAQVKEYFQSLADTSDVEVDWGPPATAANFLDSCHWLAHFATFQSTIPFWENIVFEGAQGLLLDENNRENFPHVTGSKTGLANVRTLCQDNNLPIEELEPIYITRSYLTRHGPGPFPTEDPSISFPDTTNYFNQWQRELRFGTLDSGLVPRILEDAGDLTPSLAVTHIDQLIPDHDFRDGTFNKLYLSNGPTRSTVTVEH